MDYITVITRDTKAGTLALQVSSDGKWVRATVNGKELTAALGFSELPKEMTIDGRVARNAAQGKIGGKVVGMLIYADEIKQIEAKREELRAVLRNTPESRRSRIVASLSAARNKWLGNSDRAIAGDLLDAGALARVAPAKAEVERLEAELAEFDAAHPEVVAAISAEEQSRTDRAIAIH